MAIINRTIPISTCQKTRKAFTAMLIPYSANMLIKSPITARIKPIIKIVMLHILTCIASVITSSLYNKQDIAYKIMIISETGTNSYDIIIGMLKNRYKLLF